MWGFVLEYTCSKTPLPDFQGTAFSHVEYFILPVTNKIVSGWNILCPCTEFYHGLRGFPFSIAFFTHPLVASEH